MLFILNFVPLQYNNSNYEFQQKKLKPEEKIIKIYKQQTRTE